MIKHQKKKARFIKELEEHPLVTRACNKLKISRATFYRWREEDPDFRYDVEVAQQKGREKFNDFAESKLIENINANMHQAITYWLRFNHKRYRPQAIRLYIDENDKQKAYLEQMQKLLEELMRLRGVDALIDAAVPDPESFKENLRNELKEVRNKQDEL